MYARAWVSSGASCRPAVHLAAARMASSARPHRSLASLQAIRSHLLSVSPAASEAAAVSETGVGVLNGDSKRWHVGRSRQGCIISLVPHLTANASGNGAVVLSGDSHELAHQAVAIQLARLPFC